MKGDLRAGLLEAAWAAGKLPDLAPVRPDDRLWWLRLNTRLSAYQRELEQRYTWANLIRNLIGTVVCTPESSQAQWDAAKVGIKDLRQLLFPWELKDEKTETSSMKATWESVFGKMDDPEVQANINRTAAAINAQRSRGGR